MKSATLNTKDIIIGLKKHWSVKTFLERYGFDSEEDLFAAIDKAYVNANHASKAKQEILENSRTEQKRISKKLRQFQQRISESQDEPQNENTVVEADDVSPNVSPDDTKETLLAKLNLYLDSVKNELYSDEVIQRDLHSQRKDLFAELRTIRAKIISLRASLESIQEDFNNKVLLLDATSTDLEQVNKDIAFLREEESITIQKIKLLEKVSIYIYVDGSIVAENFSGILPEADSELVKQYATDERFESLTLKELKQLCKLIAIVSVLESEEKPFELMFDNSQTESVWQILHTSSQPE